MLETLVPCTRFATRAARRRCARRLCGLGSDGAGATVSLRDGPEPLHGGACTRMIRSAPRHEEKAVPELCVVSLLADPLPHSGVGAAGGYLFGVR
jgi:hypothetical protein